VFIKTFYVYFSASLYSFEFNFPVLIFKGEQYLGTYSQINNYISLTILFDFSQLVSVSSESNPNILGTW